METNYHLKAALAEMNKRLQNLEEKLSLQPPAKNDWLDNQDICQYLHITKRTLDHYREKGILPYSKIGGKVFYRMSDVDAYLNQHIVRKEEKS